MKNLFDQAPFALRGENDARIAALTTDLDTAEAKLALIDTGAWPAWTPTWANFTVGNGTVDAKYARTGRTINYRLRVALGSTSVMGSTPKFSLPVACHAGYAANQIIGVASISDSGTADFGGVIWIFSATEGQLIVQNVAGTYLTAALVTATVPMTWTTGDGFNCFGAYEAAS